MFGEARVIVPVPLALPCIATCDMFFPYTTVQTEPVEIVTVIPLATLTVPALNPLFPDAIV